MASMLEPENYNKEQREKQIDSAISSVESNAEKSAFILALLIKQSENPTAYMNSVTSSIDSLCAAGKSEYPQVRSKFSELRTLYHEAVTIYHKIKDIN
ncbi:hypothetical protein [Yersinia kristensenii]|uniref:hypothetical protein n=1 Tax=Yersinia kristensenii TaxID=28152 RepID=UPI0005E6CE2B|nr:hypothetical protein [Yersinia kristensenii]CNK92658.1 Uncharacterised protein [Yersinia kristensenii]